MKLFVKSDCEFCSQVVVPVKVNLEIINIDEDYDGFIPTQVPVLQVNGLNLEGPGTINAILSAINDNKR